MTNLKRVFMESNVKDSLVNKLYTMFITVKISNYFVLVFRLVGSFVSHQAVHCKWCRLYFLKILDLPPFLGGLP